MRGSGKSKRNPDELVQDGMRAMELGNKQKAAKSFKLALKTAPENPNVLYAAGLLEIVHGSPQRAVFHFRKMVELGHSDARVLNNLGVALSLSGEKGDGLSYLEEAVNSAPEDPTYLHDFAKALSDNGELERSCEIYRRAHTLMPENVELLNSYGDTLRRSGDIETALEVLQDAERLAPNNTIVSSNLGVALEEAGELERAAETFEQALAGNPPNRITLLGNYSSTLRQLGRFDEAIEAGRACMALDPENSRTALKYGVLLLMNGHFEDGWKWYEMRWDTWRMTGSRALFAKKWNGEDISGKTLLVRDEQAPGDQILFSTCLADLIERQPDCQIVLECAPRLVPAMTRTYPEIEVIPCCTENDVEDGSALPAHDLEIGLGSLPAFYRRSFDEFPTSGPRKLVADPVLVEKWRQRFAELGDGRKIGIAWRGGYSSVSKLKRAIDLERLLPILNTPGCVFVNLQYGDVEEELASLAADHGVNVHDWPDVNPLVELENQLAQIEALDLVIQTTNTSAHMAGALRKEAWLMQTYSPYWVWFLDCERPPWYPELRQIRQPTLFDWDTVINQVAEELAALP